MNSSPNSGPEEAKETKIALSEPSFSVIKNEFRNFDVECESSSLVAWCSMPENRISVIDFETKQEFASFDGVQLKPGITFKFGSRMCNIHKDSNTAFQTAYVKEIPNAGLLISLQYSLMGANMGIFGISKKGQVNKIYSFEEVAGGI
mgnify:FL=1